MAAKDPLTDPTIYEELEALQEHAAFLSEQIRKDNEEIRLTMEMLQTGQLSDTDAGIIKKVQAALIEKVKSLDETTRQMQTLLGLPSVDAADIEVSNLEKDKLGANPIAPDLTKPKYGILERLPQIMLAGVHHVSLDSASPEMRPTLPSEPDKQVEEKQEEKSAAAAGAARKQEKKLQAKDRQLGLLEKKLNAKTAQLKHLAETNTMLREAFNNLTAGGHNALAESIYNGSPPANDKEADNYLQALNNERNKIDKLKEKVKNELQQQHKANILIGNGRKLPVKQTENSNLETDRSRIFDLDTERSLTSELLAYEQIKKDQERRRKDIKQQRTAIETLVNENDELKDQIEQANQELKTLNEILAETEQTQVLQVELDVVEKELDKAYETIKQVRQKQEDCNELLDHQEREVIRYRDKFIEAQEKFEANAILIGKEEEEHKNRVDRARCDMECFRANMESQLSTYRPLPFVLGVTLIQAFHIEQVTKRIIDENILLERDVAAHVRKAEDLLQQLREHEDKAIAYKAKQNQVKQIRQTFEETEHILNRYRQKNAGKSLELDDKLNRIKEKENEIEELRLTIEHLKEEHAKKHFVLQQEDEIKREARMIEMNNLELEIAKKRGLMRVLLTECSDDMLAVWRYYTVVIDQ